MTVSATDVSDSEAGSGLEDGLGGAGSMGEARRSHLLRIEMLGPRDPLDGRRLRFFREAVAGLRYPWDALVMVGVLGGLYVLVLVGSLMTAWTGGTQLSAVTGISLVGLGAAISSHLYYEAQAR